MKRGADMTVRCCVATMATILAAGLPAGPAAAIAADAPNVILVITDDQGYGDLSCHGNPVLKTPRIDTLYARSVRLTNYHVSPTCAPTRGALMSGHYTDRAGPWHTIMGRSMLYEGEKTLGEVFKSNGYATGMFGKWHLGDSYPFRPEDRGFDEVVRLGGGGVGQGPDYWDNAYFDDTYWHNSKPTKYSGYCTDVFFGEATRFIGECAAAGKPFFVYLASNAPHGPLHCPEEYWKPYVGKVKSQGDAVFLGMIANIDENVGKLRAWLDEKSLSDNTLFIFTTDNGTAGGDHIFNAGMRGKKGSEYEGGHRVPCFLHWPKGGLDKGVDVNRLTAHIDMLPTLVELCGLKPIENYKLDGRSLVPLLHDPNADWPERTIITDSQRVRDPIKWKQSSTMTERWRLINGRELYDMQADAGERKNVAGEYPEVLAKLRADYDAWWADISPVFKKDARVVIGSPAENPTHLCSHDWLTDKSMTPWNQGQIRAGVKGTGEWALRVARDGTYRITLSRWPLHLGKPIAADLPPGDPVPGMRAWREAPGKGLAIKAAGLRIGGVERERPADGSQPGIPFEVELKPGEVNLDAYFVLPDGSRTGAYYALVERL